MYNNDVNKDLQNNYLFYLSADVKYVLQVMYMKKLGKLLRELRGKESLRDASKRIGISHTYLDTIEKGFDKRSGKPVNPTPETLKLLSVAYNYSYNELMKAAGYLDDETNREQSDWDSKLPELTEKDEKDLKKDLDMVINNLSPNGGYSQYDGLTLEDMDEEDRELLIASLENSMRLAKRIAKQKFTPKKYRK